VVQSVQGDADAYGVLNESEYFICYKIGLCYTPHAMAPIVVTSGGSFTDVDALACAVAYAELARLQGKDAVAVLPRPLNHTITKMVQDQRPVFLKVAPTDVSGYVLVDISNPTWVEPFVDHAKVVAVFDHHFGYEDYWRERIGDAAQIEMIGAAATLIWEAWVAAGLEDKISATSANLLSIAIVSNTLNFKVPITSDRDHTAFAALAIHTTLPQGWVGKYLAEVEASIGGDLADILPNDLKIETFAEFDQPIHIAQVEVYDGLAFLTANKQKLIDFMHHQPSPYAFVDIPSMGDEHTYLLAENKEVQDLLSQKLGVSFADNVAVTPTLMLRKMIIKRLRTAD